MAPPVDHGGAASNAAGPQNFLEFLELPLKFGKFPVSGPSAAPGQQAGGWTRPLLDGVRVLAKPTGPPLHPGDALQRGQGQR